MHKEEQFARQDSEEKMTVLEKSTQATTTRLQAAEDELVLLKKARANDMSEVKKDKQEISKLRAELKHARLLAQSSEESLEQKVVLLTAKHEQGVNQVRGKAKWRCT